MRKNINSVVLAAGLSGRMNKFKPLLDYRGKSFIQNIVSKLNPVCDRIIIVTGFKSNEVEDNVNQLRLKGKIEFVFNPVFEQGMFTSLQAGLSKAENSDWIIYHFVDQPGLPEKFYTNFIEQIDDKYSWIQPSFKKQKGHPILIRKKLFPLIISAVENSSLREISKDPVVKKKLWDCEFREILQDVDTDEDYSNL